VFEYFQKCKIQESRYWTHETGYHVKKITISDVSEIYVAFIFNILNWCAIVSNIQLLWSVLFSAARSCGDGRWSWLGPGGSFLMNHIFAWSGDQKILVEQHYAGSSATCHFWQNNISCLVAALWDAGIIDWIMSDWRWKDVCCVEPSTDQAAGDNENPGSSMPKGKTDDSQEVK
jgi:hypothetical protein